MSYCFKTTVLADNYCFKMRYYYLKIAKIAQRWGIRPRSPCLRWMEALFPEPPAPPALPPLRNPGYATAQPYKAQKPFWDNKITSYIDQVSRYPFEMVPPSISRSSDCEADEYQRVGVSRHQPLAV